MNSTRLKMKNLVWICSLAALLVFAAASQPSNEALDEEELEAEEETSDAMKALLAALIENSGNQTLVNEGIKESVDILDGLDKIRDQLTDDEEEVLDDLLEKALDSFTEANERRKRSTEGLERVERHAYGNWECCVRCKRGSCCCSRYRCRCRCSWWLGRPKCY